MSILHMDEKFNSKLFASSKHVLRPLGKASMVAQSCSAVFTLNVVHKTPDFRWTLGLSSSAALGLWKRVLYLLIEFDSSNLGIMEGIEAQDVEREDKRDSLLLQLKLPFFQHLEALQSPCSIFWKSVDMM